MIRAERRFVRDVGGCNGCDVHALARKGGEEITCVRTGTTTYSSEIRLCDACLADWLASAVRASQRKATHTGSISGVSDFGPNDLLAASGAFAPKGNEKRTQSRSTARKPPAEPKPTRVPRAYRAKPAATRLPPDVPATVPAKRTRKRGSRATTPVAPRERTVPSD